MEGVVDVQNWDTRSEMVVNSVPSVERWLKVEFGASFASAPSPSCLLVSVLALRLDVSSILTYRNSPALSYTTHAPTPRTSSAQTVFASSFRSSLFLPRLQRRSGHHVYQRTSDHSPPPTTPLFPQRVSRNRRLLPLLARRSSVLRPTPQPPRRPSSSRLSERDCRSPVAYYQRRDEGSVVEGRVGED